MSNITKEKSKFIITLDNGKQTYFDFADGKIYGISGKVNKKFNNKAMQILRQAADNDFLAWYLTEISSPSWFVYYSDKWKSETVETIYSLFADKYSKSTLITIAEYCYVNDYALDKKGVKTISETLARNSEKAINARYIWDNDFTYEMNKTQFSNLPKIVMDLINAIRDNSNKKMRETIIKDAEKIAFRMEHENWLGTVNHSMSNLIPYLNRYLNLCEILKKEPTYKNLFLQLGYLDKEKELMQDQLNAEYQLHAPLFFENEKFITIIPTTATEFKNEADAQSNCVFRLYYPRVSERETHIVFIRKKSDITKSYITCEVDNNGNIIQYLARFNKEVTDTNAISFKAKYQEYLDAKF